MSACQKHFGDWGLFNPVRDGFCTLLSIPTVSLPMEEVPAPRRPVPMGYLFSPEVLSANWREVFNSFSPALIALGLSVAPVVIDLAYKEIERRG